jgi:hypothetical protein
VNGGDLSNAADLILTYNPAEIEILDSLPAFPGIQIQPGSAFESYAGNSVNTSTGTIKLVGYSSASNFSSTAVFASISFKPRPNVTTGSFTFQFSGANPYNTLDSNIADAITAYDILSSVSNATYNFSAGSCYTDTTPPSITFQSPINNESNISGSHPITVVISDTGGVNMNSIAVTINGVSYTSSSPNVSITGAPNSYTVTLIPTVPFNSSQSSVITVTASDFAGNVKSSNITVNSIYSCPIIYKNTITTVTGATVSCEQPKEDNTAPIIKIVPSDFSLDITNIKELIVTVSDDQIISPESFVLTLGNSIYSLFSTPNIITVTGNKKSYVFLVMLSESDFSKLTASAVTGYVKIADQQGNSTIQTLSYQLPHKNIPDSTRPEKTVAKISPLPYIGATLLFLLLILPPMHTLHQPKLISIVDEKTRKPVKFAHIILEGSSKRFATDIFGNFRHKPFSSVTVFIQKYGYVERSVSLHNTNEIITVQLRPIR